MDALERRQQRFLARLLRLEVRHVCRPSATSVGDGGPGEAWGVEQPLLGGSHERLRHELLCRGLQVHRFVRVPPNYYDTDLEARRACLQAHSVAHLCKTICVENTAGDGGPLNPQYLLVVVQYAKRFSADKLKSWLYERNGGRIARKRFSVRLAEPADSERLTGYKTGGVSPVGVATPLPIILSHSIARLQPGLFWVGAGDVDLKLGVRTADFVRAYAPAVVDVTEDA